MNIENFRKDYMARLAAGDTNQVALARTYGLQQAVLSRFAAGKSGLSFDSVVKLWPFVYGTPFPHVAEEAPDA